MRGLIRDLRGKTLLASGVCENSTVHLLPTTRRELYQHLGARLLVLLDRFEPTSLQSFLAAWALTSCVLHKKWSVRYRGLIHSVIGKEFTSMFALASLDEDGLFVTVMQHIVVVVAVLLLQILFLLVVSCHFQLQKKFFAQLL